MNILKSRSEPCCQPELSTLSVPPDLWATRIMPEGILECWLVPDGGKVSAGDPVARLSIEGRQHTLPAGANGRLKMLMKANSIVEPGCVIGQVMAAAD